jgi:hypothetical protein
MPASWHERFMQAAAAMAADEEIAGLGRVYVRKTRDALKAVLPCVIVDLEGAKATLQPFDTESDVRGLQVNVHLLHRSDMRDDATLGKWLTWSQGLHDAFLMQLPPGLPEVLHVEVRPGEALDVQALIGPAAQAAAASVVLEAQVITPRRRP